MPVVIVSPPGLTLAKYEESVRRLIPSGRIESPSDWPVEGLLVHTAGEAPDGFRVVDVWESEDAARQFGEVMKPILRELGVTDPPEFYSVQVFVSA